MGNFWDTKQTLAPSPSLVQSHFVKARLDAINRQAPGLAAKVGQILTAHPLLAHLRLTGDKWVEVYDRITQSLQAADLTINIDAQSWFATENLYDGYTQMYQRGSVLPDGRRFIAESKMNGAGARARIDDAVTFPASGPARPKSPVPGAPATPAAHRGLRPGRQGQERVEAQMRFFDPQPASVTHADGTIADGVASPNRHFNPHTKQVFAGLNYGRRPNGSCTTYGKSFFVLSPKFKAAALYFPEDTFYESRATQVQTAHQTLGTLLAWAGSRMIPEIIQGCYLGRFLPSTNSPYLLLEAHIFSELPFAGSFVSLSLAEPSDSVVAANARKFAARHAIKLLFI